MLKKFYCTALALAVTGAFLLPGLVDARTTFVTIGTGGVTGVYYPAGGAIAKMVNRKRKEYNLRVTVESTGGSVFNVNAIAEGKLEFGVVQSDRQFQAYYGKNDWGGRPVERLRSVFAIHPEAVTIVANASKNIRTIADLKGKVVNIGNPGSGQRGNAEDLFAVAGIDMNKEITIEEMKAAESASALQDGRIDAFFYTVGHPNDSIKETIAGGIKVNFVAIPADMVKELTEKYSFYAPAEIPVENYRGVTNTADVPTFGVKATLCTSSAVPEEVVYAITKEVFENLADFKKLHPAFAGLTEKNMLQGLSAPLHPGAARYFKEAGLME